MVDVWIFVDSIDNSGSTKNKVFACLKQIVPPDFRMPEEGQYKIKEKGKPYLENCPYQFNVSHSGKYWICAISKQDVGIDIQQCVPDKDYAKIADRFFEKREINYLFDCDYREFYKIWAAKESYVKLLGEGISMGFDTFSVVYNGKIAKKTGNMFLNFIHIDKNYECCLCTKQRINLIFVNKEKQQP